MKVLVSVTQEDIDSGAPACPSRCPVARALERAVGPCDNVQVTCSVIRYRQNNVAWIGATPWAATRFIRHFDDPLAKRSPHWKAGPFSFEVAFKKDRDADLAA